ncbi:MAG: hypothetical protein OHK0039_25690 [Bacteroidia bacterium]
MLRLGAQSLPEVQATALGDSVSIRYVLPSGSQSSHYQVSVHAILGRDTVKLTRLRGAVGDSISAGEHTLYWQARAELGRYRGPVRFDVQAVPYFTFISPETNTLLRRGKPYTFRWYGGNSAQDTLQLELYQFDRRIGPVAIVSRANTYTWKLPGDMELGEGYRLKLSSTDEAGLTAFSPTFDVQRKTPLWLLIAPPAAAAGGLAAILILARKPLPGPAGDPDNSAAPAYETGYDVK